MKVRRERETNVVCSLGLPCNTDWFFISMLFCLNSKH